MNDPKISDSLGNPIDIHSPYLPNQFLYERIRDTLVISDSLEYLFCSEDLFARKETILQNYYLGKTIYRLTLIPGIMGYHASITLTKVNDSFYVQNKMLTSPMEYSFIKRHYIGSNGVDSVWSKPQDTNLSIATKTHVINKKDYYQIASLIESDSFNNLLYRSTASIKYTDNPGFLLEVHSKNGYNVIYRWADQNEHFFQKILDAFFKVSNYTLDEQNILQQQFKEQKFIK